MSLEPAQIRAPSKIWDAIILKVAEYSKLVVMSLELAHMRTPFEIWDAILNIAVLSPLVPCPDDDIVDLDQLFVTKCSSQWTQRRVENIRTRLRLVCREWNTILRDKCVKMVLDAFNDGSAHRYEESEDGFRCRCVPACIYPGEDWLEGPYIENIAEQFPNLKLFAGLYTNRYTIKEISSMAPRLQALQYRCVPVSGRVDVWPPRIRIKSLTHLELTEVDQATTTPVGEQVTLPRLSVLSLKFVCGPPSYMSTSVGEPWLQRWSLPDLKTLKMDGSIAWRWIDEIGQFLARAWPNVTSLSLNLSCEERFPPFTHRPYVIGSTFWTCFPNLRTFGPGPTMLAANTPPPPPPYKPFSLVVDTMWDEFGMSGKSLSRALQIIDEWKIATVILLHEWEGVINMLVERNRQRTNRYFVFPDNLRPSPFLAAAIDRNIRLLDIERAPLSPKNNAELLELVQNWEVDCSTAAFSGDQLHVAKIAYQCDSQTPRHLWGK